MKLLVDKMPVWSTECLFSEDVWEVYGHGREWHGYKCKLRNDWCELYDTHQCPWLKEGKIANEN